MSAESPQNDSSLTSWIDAAFFLLHYALKAEAELNLLQLRYEQVLHELEMHQRVPHR
jgi:hypothetical protein